MDGRPRHVMTGIESDKRDQLTHIPKGAYVAALGQEFTNGQVAQALNGTQQVGLPFQVRMLVQDIRDRLLGVGNLRIQEADLRLPVFDQRLESFQEIV